MRIEEEYIRSGYFWLPGNETNKLPGTLTILNGGEIELEIIGQFNDSINSFNNNDINRILGHIEKDGYVTLDNCFYTVKNHVFNGIAKSNIFAHKLFSGVIYSKDEDPTFNSLSFSVDCLDE